MKRQTTIQYCIALLIAIVFLFSSVESVPIDKSSVINDIELQTTTTTTTTSETNIQDIDTRINSVIDYHYNALINNPKYQQAVTLVNMLNGINNKDKSNNPKPHSPVGYKCQHDRFMERQNNKLKNIPSSSTTNEIKNNNNNNNDNAVTGSKLIQETNAAPRQPMRIFANTTYISGTDPYACYSAGSTVVTGGPIDAHPPPCVSNMDLDVCTYTCRQEDVLSSSLQNYIMDSVVGAIKEVIGSIILVDRVDTLKFDGDTRTAFGDECGDGISVPEGFVTDGVPNFDFYLWVTSRPTADPSTVAYAFACNYKVLNAVKKIYSKPIAALINFNPRYFNPDSLSSKFQFNMYIRVGLHEISHALGFSNTFYNSFVKDDGEPYDAASIFTTKGKSPNGSSYSVSRSGITSDKVVDFAREHYGCSTIKHVDLEDAGSSGTQGSHWEKRVAGEEYMIGYVQGIEPITNLTLSLFKDTGWYDVNATNAEPLLWGKKLGCSWYGDSCSSNNWNYEGYWCLDGTQYGCTPTRMGKGRCYLNRYSSVPTEYQHFKDEHLAGDLIADGCVFNNAEDHVSNITHYCVDDTFQATANPNIFEAYGTNSRCFEWNNNGVRDMGCWEQKCNEFNQASIKVGDQWAVCQTNGQLITVNNVTIICPLGYAACGGTPQALALNAGNTIPVISNILLITLPLLFITLVL